MLPNVWSAKENMGDIYFITRYRTFDIKMNASRKFIVTFDSHFLTRFPYEFEESFEIVSEAKDAIDSYWRTENRKFAEGMLS
jgi:hypothetical protein